MKEITMLPSMVLCIIQGMNEVSNADGQVPAERELLRAFYEGCREDVTSLPVFESIENDQFDAELASHALVTDDQKKLFASLCVLCGYADGHYTEVERQVVERLALSVGLNADILKGLERDIAETLASQVSHLTPTDGLASVMENLFGTAAA